MSQSHENDERALLQASQAGDREAFGELIERYQSAVCAVAYSATGDHELSEDAAQEAFLTAWQKLRDVSDPAKLPAWLCAIARNHARNANRREQVRRRTAAPSWQHPRDPLTPLDDVITKETQTRVWQALEAIPETLREPLILFYRDGQSIKQVARGMGLSEAATKKRLARGRKHLAGHLAGTAARALRATRPGKAFTVAALGLIATATVSRDAAASSLALNSSGSGLGLGLRAGVLAAVLALVVAGAAFMWPPSSGSADHPASPPSPRDVHTQAPAQRALARDTQPSSTPAPHDPASALTRAAQSAPRPPEPLPRISPEIREILDQSAGYPLSRFIHQPLVRGRLLQDRPHLDKNGDGAISEREYLAIKQASDNELLTVIRAARRHGYATVQCSALAPSSPSAVDYFEYYDLVSYPLETILAAARAESGRSFRVCATVDTIPLRPDASLKKVLGRLQEGPKDTAWHRLGIFVDDGLMTGLVVAHVRPGSPAERAGIMPQPDGKRFVVVDYILAMNGEPVATAVDFLARADAIEPGDSIQLAVANAGAESPKVRQVTLEIPENE